MLARKAEGCRGVLRGAKGRELYAVCHDDGADHTGAQVALLAGRDEVGG